MFCQAKMAPVGVRVLLRAPGKSQKSVMTASVLCPNALIQKRLESNEVGRMGNCLDTSRTKNNSPNCPQMEPNE
jgi:hypothetical protein